VNFTDRLVADATPVRDAIRAALENGVTLRITGTRGWTDAGRPVTASDELSVTAGGVVEYVPGDLTLTVRAGTPLADITGATAEHGQWLPLDPFGPPAGTIGATVATRSAGPLAHAYGTPRDQVIGLGFVTGRGDYVRAGGRVVKNVAGFDLTRLLIGSWGTLGVITDVTLRLRALPDRQMTLTLVLSEESVALRRTLDAVSDARVAPLAMELVNSALARHLALDGGTLLLVRLGGNPPLVSAQQKFFAALGEIRELDMGVWDRLRAAEPPAACVVRYSGPLTEFAAMWRGLDRRLAATGSFLHGTPGRGVVRCIVPADQSSALLDLPEPGHDLSRIFERLPAEAWRILAPGPVNDRLSTRVREAFDPGRLLNPGILGEQLA